MTTLNQLDGTQLHVVPLGSSLKFLLPSGTEIHIEVTQDSLDVTTQSGRVLLSEERYEEEWMRMTPQPDDIDKEKSAFARRNDIERLKRQEQLFDAIT